MGSTSRVESSVQGVGRLSWRARFPEQEGALQEHGPGSERGFHSWRLRGRDSAHLRNGSNGHQKAHRVYQICFAARVPSTSCVHIRRMQYLLRLVGSSPVPPLAEYIWDPSDRPLWRALYFLAFPCENFVVCWRAHRASQDRRTQQGRSRKMAQGVHGSFGFCLRQTQGRSRTPSNSKARNMVIQRFTHKFEECTLEGLAAQCVSCRNTSGLDPSSRAVN